MFELGAYGVCQAVYFSGCGIARKATLEMTTKESLAMLIERPDLLSEEARADI
jgi:hypothetical protein